MSEGELVIRYVLDEGEGLTAALVTALSEAKGQDITMDRCVLYDTVDPDALDAIFHNEKDAGPITVEFRIFDHLVMIRGTDQIVIEVYEPAEQTPQ